MMRSTPVACLRPLFAIALLGLACAAQAQSVIARYTFTGSSGSQLSNGASLVQVNTFNSFFARGPGIVPVTGTDSMNSSGWTLGTSIDASDYYTFTLQAAPGFELDLAGLSFTERRSGTGPASFELRSSLDAFAAAAASGATSPDPLETLHNLVLGPAFEDIAGPVEFRLYAYGATGAAGTWRIIDQLEVTGSVNAIPEPETYALLLAGLGLLGFAARRRRAA